MGLRFYLLVWLIRLPEIISKHSKRKPVMIFCCTRNSAIATAKDLAKLWTNSIPRKQPWPVGPKIPIVKNPDLKGKWSFQHNINTLANFI
jgi:hypothetical protein